MRHILILAVGMAVVLSGCSSKPTKSGSDVVDKSAATSTDPKTHGVGQDPGSAMDPLQGTDPGNPLSVRTIYFDYDSSDILPEYQKAVEAHAAYLASRPERTMALEGHADERGSREYNLALGERRALSVKRQMVLLGAGANQIRTTSYGEERPVVDAHDDASWSQNRRVEIVY